MIEVVIAAPLIGGGLSVDPGSAPPAGFYVAGDVGLQDGRLVVDGAARPPTSGIDRDGTYDLTEDWSVHLRAGYRLSDAWRIEAEGAQRTSETGDVCYAGGGCVPSGDYWYGQLGGDLERTSLHLNVLHDLPLTDWAPRPFVGAGIGATQVAMSERQGRSDDLAWSWQLIAGGAFEVTPRLSLDVTYRYVRVVDVETYSELRGGAPGQCYLVPCRPPPDGINLGVGPGGPAFGEDHILTLGLRYALGRPRP